MLSSGRHLLLLVLASSLAFCFFLSSVDAKKNKEADVCILGAGASGMHTAWMLKDRHKDVVVFEKESEIGGHCKSYRFKYANGTDGVLEAGVVIFPNTTYADSLGFGPWGYDMSGIVRRFAGPNQIIPTPFISDVNPLKIFQYNVQTGEDYGQFIPDLDEDTFGQAVFQLLTIMQTEFPWMDNFVNVPSTIPAELLMPFDQWLISRNLEPLFFIFNSSLFYGGYGNLSELAALTALVQAGTPTDLQYTLAASPQGWFSLKRGCLSMYEGIANYIGWNNINVNVTIKRVMRNGNGPIRIHYKRGNHPANNVQKCKKVVVAFPPTLDRLNAFELTNKELALFGGVYVHHQTVSVANATGPTAAVGERFTIQNTNRNNTPNGDPYTPAFTQVYRYNIEGPSLVQGIGSVSNPIPQLEFEGLVRAQVTTIPQHYLTNVTYITKFYPHYFNPVWPVSKLSQTPNPFLKLDQIQGEKNTYWVGALRSTGTTAYIIKSIMELLNTHLH